MNMQQMMKQAQKMQGNMEKIQKEIEAKEFSTTVGGGVVNIVMTGDKIVKNIEIKEEILEPDEKEMLQDLIKSAINQTIEDIEKHTKEKMGPLTQGLPF